jgi:hypothetical protein
MTDRPIIFSAPMVLALLAGRQTQTRRLLKINRIDDVGLVVAEGRLPYHVGDRLWVREEFSGERRYDYNSIPPREWATDTPVWHWADGDPAWGDWTKRRPSIHMPRWASRLMLTVTDVRAHRLQEIENRDCVAEGLHPVGWEHGPNVLRDEYRDLWNSLHGPCAWDANPWVVAVSFTVERKNIDD